MLRCVINNSELHSMVARIRIIMEAVWGFVVATLLVKYYCFFREASLGRGGPGGFGESAPCRQRKEARLTKI